MVDEAGSVLRSTRLTVAPLEEDNWRSWKVSMHAVLQRRRLWFIVSGGVPRPRAGSTGSGTTELQEWLQADGEAYGEIVLHVSDLYRHLLEDADTSADAWARLCAHFEHAGSSA